MLTHRDRGWSIVRESLRRERRINDILNASGAARLSRRVALAGVRNRDWRTAEQEIRLIEHDIRRLDPVQPDFWQRYNALEALLVERFAAAGITFEID